jgi:hypothetical protein
VAAFVRAAGFFSNVRAIQGERGGPEAALRLETPLRMGSVQVDRSRPEYSPVLWNSSAWVSATGLNPLYGIFRLGYYAQP